MREMPSRACSRKGFFLQRFRRPRSAMPPLVRAWNQTAPGWWAAIRALCRVGSWFGHSLDRSRPQPAPWCLRGNRWMDADDELVGGVPGAATFIAVEVDQRAESVRFAADDRDHQGKSKRDCADEGLRGSADAQPDGQAFLHWSRRRTGCHPPVSSNMPTALASGPIMRRPFERARFHSHAHHGDATTSSTTPASAPVST